MSEALYEQRPLRDAVDRHIGGGTPPRQVPSYWKGNIPWASVKDFSEQQSVILDTEEHISAAGLHASASNLIPAQTPLVCTRMAVGRTALPLVPMAINQDVKALFPASGVSAEYLLKLMQHIQPLAEGRAVGSTVKGIRIQEYLNIPVPLAPQKAQPIIAQILDTLDTAIRESEALIDKLKAVKQGLLHDLLTRGIDANGQLRPPQSEAPQLYKKSPLGWIPRGWEVVEVGGVLLGIDAGWSPNCPEEPPSAGEWGVLKLSAITSGQYNSAEAKRLPSNLKPIPSLEVHAGDALLARANGVAEFVARTVVVEETPSLLMLSDKTLRLVPDQSRLLTGHLVRAMAFEKTRQQIGGMLNGSSGQKNISQRQICKLMICLPSVLEQSTGDTRVNEINKHLKTESLSLGKLFELKVGLMDDLLTGRVRVTPLLESVQQDACPMEA
ncbi:restriction endonuclease subunit S [Pseudomonas brassicacearum]|uniref:restriction endonuclease subunit S n=1 Tax=Pseudomonas brassicacearum TaxID=930166 RepID=UPI001295DC6E|nr:restriction endonuclease subunit S [Pseudomonas brassicacearum]QGA52274.1 restriction endonuclease subunit S [Pseudomonas brassicacearum]